jgi:short-subunit dehydrogenase
MIKRAAITGHTSGLGASFYRLLAKQGYEVHGFSRTNNYDLRDYSHVSRMLKEVKDFDLFVNNAKPEYTQAQIVYRLVREWARGTILSIGSQATFNPPGWTDTFLLEYLTQKAALVHAHQVLEPIASCRMVIRHPHHLDNNTDAYVEQIIKELDL